MNSIWMKDYINKNLPKVSTDLTTPFLIIGGGIAGLMTAYNFTKNKIDFLLVESRTLASGVSASTTAQVTVAHDAIYYDISKKYDEKTAKAYFKSQLEGLDIIKDIIKTENINCDYKEESTILCSSEQNNIEILNKQFEVLKKDDNNVLLTLDDNIFNQKKGLEFKNQFIFNPIKYMMEIIDILSKKNVSLFENSKVTKINKLVDNYEVIINDKYKILTEKIIMACHYPFLNPDNLYFTKIYQSKSYAVAFKSTLKLKANYISLDEPFFYIRTYDDETLIIGGCDHYTGDNNDVAKCYQTLIDKIHELDKNAIIVCKWFTEDCMPIDSLPFVGKYSNNNSNILLITGFQKWGFTNSHIAAKNIVNMVLNKEYDETYKTSRHILIKNLKSTFRMIGHSIDGLIISKLKVKKGELHSIKIDSGKVIRYNDANVLVYRESKDKYIFLKNKCTHMGCSLMWNDADKVWESKCHGSIFDKYGHIIYGPAIKDLEAIEW